jgi:hypothetical protein
MCGGAITSVTLRGWRALGRRVGVVEEFSHLYFTNPRC